jgi:hypothetical protein
VREHLPETPRVKASQEMTSIDIMHDVRRPDMSILTSGSTLAAVFLTPDCNVTYGYIGQLVPTLRILDPIQFPHIDIGTPAQETSKRRHARTRYCSETTYASEGIGTFALIQCLRHV